MIASFALFGAVLVILRSPPQKIFLAVSALFNPVINISFVFSEADENFRRIMLALAYIRIISMSAEFLC